MFFPPDQNRRLSRNIGNKNILIVKHCLFSLSYYFIVQTAYVSNATQTIPVLDKHKNAFDDIFRAYKEDIGKYSNMKTQMFEDELYYVCHDERELHHIRTEAKNSLVMHRLLLCMDVLIAAAAYIKQNIFINMMLKKMQRKIRS